jgi:esterase/lipase superfamily enzyme
VDYHEALAVVVEILTELVQSRIEINANTLISDIVSTDTHIPNILAVVLDNRAGLSITPNEIIGCRTVQDVASLLVVIFSRDETTRSQLSQFGTDGEQFDGCDYAVWYGTNRRPGNGMLGYSALRDTAVHHGLCRVLVPKSHKVGSLGSPWWKRALTGADDRLQLLSIKELGVEEYWPAMKGTLEAFDIEDRDAVIFVHGYNVSFADAALRAAQIGFDLSIRGAMTFFSWPSQGATSGYMADEATIEASEAAITEFMVDVATRSNARAVHVIAHSMGNRAVLRAVNRIAADAERQSRVLFDQIILAAADVDADSFRQLCVAYGRVSKRATLYVSAKDLAVEASGWLHQFPRVGLIPPICVIPGIDTVNVTNVDLSMLGHGYVAAARDVLHDMHDLITHGTAPDRRFGLREAVTMAGERFWIIGA